MLEGARFTKVRKYRPFIWSAFNTTRQLRQSDNRHVKFTSNQFKITRDFGHLLLTVFATLTSISTLHQLNIIDDNEIEAMFHLETAQFRAHILYGKTRRIIDKELGFTHAIRCGNNLFPVSRIHVRTAQFFRAHTCHGGQNTTNELFLAHFQGKERHRLVVQHRYVLSDVQGESCFPHRRTSRYEDEVRFL